jgi:hypothetical protein
MVGIDEELEAGKEAQAVVNSLVPSTPDAEAQKDILRGVSHVATIAMQPNLSRQNGSQRDAPRRGNVHGRKEYKTRGFGVSQEPP